MHQQSRRPHRNRHKADAEPQAGDELVGEWKREQLEAMDAKFADALEHAAEGGRWLLLRRCKAM